MQLNQLNKYLTVSALAVSALTSLPALSSNYKHVAVAPNDMAQQALPQASSKGLFSHSTMLPVSLNTLGGKQSFEQQIFLDGANDSPILLLAPQAGQFMMKVTNPLGKVVYDESQATSAKAVTAVQVGPQTFNGKQYAIDEPMAGKWTVSLTYKGNVKNTLSAKQTMGYLLYKGDSAFQAFSYLDNNFTTQNNDINLVAYMVDASHSRGERQKMVTLEPSMGAIDSVVAMVKTPSGKQHRIILNDDGINGDKLAGDGKYSAKMPSSEVGVYTSQVQYKGVHANGKVFTRTTTDIYPIAAKSFEFAKGPAVIKSLKGTKATLSVPVKQLTDSNEVHLSAELWGTDSQGNLRSAAWVGGITQPEKANGRTELSLNFDTRWLSRQGLQAPYSLKSVRLQTVDGNVPLAQKANIPARGFGLSKPDAKLALQSQTITQDMLMGQAPVNEMASAGSGSKLLLVHGYCSGQAWLESHFSDAVEFKDYKQNISHNTFAQRVRDFGATYNSFGVVAHSQGGAASLELYTKYWSGLDNASGGSLIQSVGTPYQGTALAGNLAALGDVFGAGCGKNTDLTYSGASNWLATIPSWARAKVDYYTTSFDTAWWRYDYCHLATDLFLDDPEDGTTEKWSGQLSGAVNKGHKKGQCHTSGMRDPAQTRDTGRNSSMSSRAAR